MTAKLSKNPYQVQKAPSATMDLSKNGYVGEDRPGVTIVLALSDDCVYANDALESVLSQEYPNWELIVLDQGTDAKTFEMASRWESLWPERIRVHRTRSGSAGGGGLGFALSEARHALISFIDPRSTWSSDKLAVQVRQLTTHHDAGLTYGPMLWSFQGEGKEFVEPMGLVTAGIYAPSTLAREFLLDPALTPGIRAALIRREVLEAVGEVGRIDAAFFDSRSLWLKLILAARVCVGGEPLVHYRSPAPSAASRIPATSLGIVPHKSLLDEELDFACWANKHLTNQEGLGDEVVKAAAWRLDWAARQHIRLSARQLRATGTVTKLAPHISSFYLKLARDHAWNLARRSFARHLRMTSARAARRAAGAGGFLRLAAPFRLALGLRPLSEVYGTDWGTAIHRYYLEKFMQEHADDVRGRCLEFESDTYASRYGKDRIYKLDIWHIDHSNPNATMVGDLLETESLPERLFDCIICTHVLHVIPDPAGAIRGLSRMLKPDGVLLLAVPGIGMWGGPGVNDLWRFTPEGGREVAARASENTEVVVRSYGNSLVAAGEIRGLAAEAFSRSQLDHVDERFPVEVCVRVKKAPEAQ